MAEALPNRVRYIKNGEGTPAGGRWWKAACVNGQVHAGWSDISGDILLSNHTAAVASTLRASRYSTGKRGFTQDLNQLLALLDEPSKYIWITFEDGCMWWCTVRDGITLNPNGEGRDRGHFWLTCDRPWSNTSLGGRELATANLPGIITTTQGFRGTTCTPDGANEILRVISDGEDLEAAAAICAREAYEGAVLKLVRRLHAKDFEVLIDLILSRTGWARLAKLGGVTEGIDVEVENAATDEIAFVQVKSKAGQSTLSSYVEKFQSRPRYKRMIFALHTSSGALTAPDDPRIQVWDGARIAILAVKHGLGDWVASRV